MGPAVGSGSLLIPTAAAAGVGRVSDRRATCVVRLKPEGAVEVERLGCEVEPAGPVAA